MQPEKRKTAILNALRDNGSASVADIAGRFRVAPMTVRRDLTELEAKGLLIKRYGGAVASSAAETLFSFAERQGRNKVEKRAIGEKAAALIRDNETVFIDCGSTPYQVSLNLTSRKGLRVITNSLPVVQALMTQPHVRVTLLGGDIVHERRSAYGRLTRKALAEYRADKAFIGADGISLTGGLSAYDEQEGLVSGKMAERAREVYLVCDSGKIEKDSFFPYMPIEKVKGVITDNGIDRAVAAQYRKKGINLIIA